MITIALICMYFSSPKVRAEGWQWPWEKNKSEKAQPSILKPLPAFPNSNFGLNKFDPLERAPICLQLERRLAAAANQDNMTHLILPELEKEIKQTERQVYDLELQLEKSQCYERFFFSRSLRGTRNCVVLDQTMREASGELKMLRTQQQKIFEQGDRSNQDNIIKELAQNNCGGVYNREARRRDPFLNFWQDEENDDDKILGNTFAGLPFATYRTVCVRLCDGFYFPVSFSTLPTHFNRDAKVCQSRCAAPSELYFHQNPGESVDQMVAHQTQKPYTQLKTAFRYRREYVSECSCEEG